MKREIKKKSNIWVFPLFLGIFFGLGYGLTHRFWILLGSWKEYSRETIKVGKSFPSKTFKVISSPDSEEDSGSNLNLQRREHIPTSQTNQILYNKKNSKLTNILVKVKKLSEPSNGEPAFSKETMFSKDNFDKVLKTLTE